MEVDNPRRSGECAYCGEESDRLFDAPLFNPPDWKSFETSDSGSVWWRQQLHPASSWASATYSSALLDVVELDHVSVLRHYESPDEPICWLCFDGHISPNEYGDCVNVPKQIKLNGWKGAVWADA